MHMTNNLLCAFRSEALRLFHVRHAFFPPLPSAETQPHSHGYVSFYLNPLFYRNKPHTCDLSTVANFWNGKKKKGESWTDKGLIQFLNVVECLLFQIVLIVTCVLDRCRSLILSMLVIFYWYIYTYILLSLLNLLI